VFKKGDFILLAGIAAAIIAGILLQFAGKESAGHHKVAVIRQGDTVLHTIDLDAVKEQRRIQIDGDYHNTILVENGRIRYELSDCPDKVCVKTGWLDKPSLTAACLPNRTIVKVTGENDELDVRIR